MLRRAEAATNNSALVSPTWDFSLGKMRRRLGGKIVTIADCKNLLRPYYMSIFNFDDILDQLRSLYFLYSL